ncbi:lysine-ketoglutarate reductase/saccharopine dehydrogenase bifunctional enzyme [Reticulomyxa filosa]|uniref:Lysine-ketoglutarate reductase/saccharopine dehydrogenase bifunctional enzyme n=1 Tax=Reticulomyxa filosa TaxID=46433 RepID=X6NLW2_RETFI|nr:lysine-ketoglutarate reductase/saccharopine dehydrogenase bifunctional enzyme [Reticulomyxa filosa]|eukprot:ETO26986.1 lysine-ketoglutarate reductase/saccharopine dehydrogenase bifunctional enzyme [Reticulomyxa filosa]
MNNALIHVCVYIVWVTKTHKNTAEEVIRIEGHLFDSGLINQIFDLIEQHGGEYRIITLHSGVNTNNLRRASRLILQISIEDKLLPPLLDHIASLVKLLPKAQAVLKHLPYGAVHSMVNQKTSETSPDADSSDILPGAPSAPKSTLHNILRVDKRV